MKRALVFGGSGFLGSYVADELVVRGYKVTIFDKKESPWLGEKKKFIGADVLDLEAVVKAVKNADVVYNFAGLADINVALTHPLETVRLNILGNTHVLEACRLHGKIERYIFASSAYAFSSKGSFYGVSKHSCEKIIEEYSKQFKLPYTIIRYGSVYGERSDDQNRIFRLIRQAILEKKITFKGNGEEEREYIHARDAATLSVNILSKEFANQHLILTGIERFKYKELLRMISEMMGDKIKIEILRENYKGHYLITPYSFSPTTSRKVVNNPFIDMGQGLLEIINRVHQDLKEKGKIS